MCRLQSTALQEKITAIQIQHLKNIYYYGLKQVDIDGRFIYFTIMPVKSGDDKKFAIYPNPIQKGESLQFRLQNITASEIEIINAGGQIVYSSTTKQTGRFS